MSQTRLKMNHAIALGESDNWKIVLETLWSVPMPTSGRIFRICMKDP